MKKLFSFAILAACILWGNLPAGTNNRPIKLSICEGWKFCQEGSGQWHTAQVPGCVHTDLLNDSLISDPFFGTNEKSLQWIGEKNWIYKTTFDVPMEMLQNESVELVFEGLDTYAEITLNGSAVLSANDMFRTWRVDCKKLLRKKENRLAIRFRNVFDENMPKYRSAPFELQAFDNNDQAETKIAMYSRKAQFHYGWDWGPRLITCGIWHPVYIEAWSGFKINNIHVQQKNVFSTGADILSTVNIQSARKQTVTAMVFLDSLTLCTGHFDLQPGANKVQVQGHISNPILWWTNGLGEPHLYSYRAAVTGSENAQDEYSAYIGIRSLEIVREKDTQGRSMYVRLNGVPVFMKGSNYIPQDNFQNRVTKERYEHIIRSAADAHMNMLRVWGGGIFEDDLFYELCDRYGILVWQEMMFACAMYPGDDEFTANVRQEVIDNIVRLRNHPCIALYCGNNENEAGWFQWGWKQKYDKTTQQMFEQSAENLFYEVIPSALHEADSTRYYHPTSPIAGIRNTPYGEGDIHYWGVWHGKEPFETFTTNIARFVSEYGFQSYPELSTISEYARPEERQLHSEVMLSHQRCMADARQDKEYGNRLIQTYMERWYRTPKDFDSYVYVSQVLQAEGVKIAMEAHRRAMPFCMGSLYWQIDDCWPVASWSSIDYYGKWKALHYAARNAYQPILISPIVSEQDFKVYVVSDQLNDTEVSLAISVMDFEGKMIFQQSMPAHIKANSSECIVTLQKPQLTGTCNESQVIVVSRLIRGKEKLSENISYLKPPKDLELHKPKISMNIQKTSSGFLCEVTSNTLAKNVFLNCSDDHAFYSNNYFDLLPNVKELITVDTQLNQKDFEQTLKIVNLFESCY
ncbi:MAG: glycoside hydrolase family 2 protein [Bacteroidota bacterium]